ncbi:MAG: type II secretion system F family protein [Nanoarchaeota archaeon]
MARISSFLVPRKIRKRVEELIGYGGKKLDVNRFFDFVVSFSLAFAIIMLLGAAFILHISTFYSVFTFIVTLVVMLFIFYYQLLMHADKRAKQIEAALPDALQLMASNLRAGLTTDRALLLSSRPEFGLLKIELDRIGKEVATGRSLQSALLDFSRRVNSEKVRKTMQLIISGIGAGGELASLLEYTARNLREKEIVDKKVRSNVLMYAIFIFVAVGIGAPILFSLSSFLVQVLTQQLSTVEIPQATQQNIPFAFTGVNIDPSFVFFFVLFTLVTIAILGSLALGLITKGEEKEGIKFIPLLIALSLFIFFIVRRTVSNLLSGLFGLS